MAHRLLLVVGMKRDDENGIDERSFRFFRDVLTFVETIPVGPRTNKIIEPLVGSAGSIGANREEALDEGRQLARILGRIVVTTKRRSGYLPKPKPKP